MFFWTAQVTEGFGAPETRKSNGCVGARRYDLEIPASLEGVSDSEQRRIIVEMISESVGLPLESMLKEVNANCPATSATRCTHAKGRELGEILYSEEM